MNLTNYNVEPKKPDTKSTCAMIPFIYCFKQMKQIFGDRSQNTAYIWEEAVVTGTSKGKVPGTLHFLTWSLVT